MKPFLTLLFVIGFCLALNAQIRQPFITDHQHHLTRLSSSRDSLYQQTLKAYDRYLRSDAGNYRVQLERCRFIEKAYYDSYEDYNPNYEESMACADSLLKIFPATPEVLLYPTELIYSDTLIAYLLTLEERIQAEPEVWKGHDWKVYSQLSEQYGYNEENDKAIRYGKLAVEQNDTLDLSLTLGRAYLATQDNSSAIEVLIAHLDSADNTWQLQQKGELLLQLGVPDKAIEAFQMASRKNDRNSDGGSLAKAMIKNGLVAEARPYLLEDFQSSGDWNRAKTSNALFLYDLDHGAADSAFVSYQRMTDKNFNADLFGVYRLRLFLKAPSMPWTLSDGGRILLMVLLLVAALILPYLWILPIHYIGSYLKSRGKVFDTPPFHWGLRHFWMACSAWLFLTLLSTLIFYYPELISNFDTRTEVEPTTDLMVGAANANILFFSGLLIFAIALLPKDEFAGFFAKLKSRGTDIGVGIGLAFALRAALVIYAMVFRGSPFDITAGNAGLASINEVIRTMIQFYNPMLAFLFVVIFVPFYEEVLFRGVLLSSTTRNMSFLIANILQSCLFAVAHQNMQYFIFYFAFGMVAGTWTRKSGSLVTSTAMHMTNNLMAFAAILTMK